MHIVSTVYPVSYPLQPLEIFYVGFLKVFYFLNCMNDGRVVFASEKLTYFCKRKTEQRADKKHRGLARQG